LTSNETLLDSLLARRDEERQRSQGAKFLIAEEDARLEENRNGRMRWYLHPDLPGACINSMLVYRHEIPPGGRTGLQKIQGNVVSYVVQGSGRSIVNGVEHRWAEGDVIALPPLLHGVTVEHHNDSSEQALLITAEPNLLDAFGVDMGSGFEQVADAPESENASE
jgi:quercetin dioxygenase-like cupin family protein